MLAKDSAIRFARGESLSCTFYLATVGYLDLLI